MIREPGLAPCSRLPKEMAADQAGLNLPVRTWPDKDWFLSSNALRSGDGTYSDPTALKTAFQWHILLSAPSAEL